MAAAGRAVERSERPGGWLHHPRSIQVPEHLDLVIPLDGDPVLELHMVFSRDGTYVPALVRMPALEGRFPAVVCLHGGSGGLGWSYLLRELRDRPMVLDRLVEEGYVVCFTEGRMEREDVYGPEADATLDYEDVVEVFRYVQRLPTVDPGRVGFFGVSHGGELQMKVVSGLREGPAALVPAEPAVIEFLGLRHEGGSAEDSLEQSSEDSSGPRIEERLQFRELVRDEDIDLARALERVEAISDGLPILVLGRDDDHLQGLFRKLYELLAGAGKLVSWDTWDHPEHAYQWGPRAASRQEADDVQRATLERVVGFLNRHVRDRGP